MLDCCYSVPPKPAAAAVAPGSLDLRNESLGHAAGAECALFPACVDLEHKTGGDFQCFKPRSHMEAVEIASIYSESHLGVMDFH